MFIIEYHKKAWELIKSNLRTVLFFALGVGVSFQLLFLPLSRLVGYQNPYVIFFGDLYASFTDAVSADEFQERIILPVHFISALLFAVQFCGTAFVAAALFVVITKSHENVKPRIRDVFAVLWSHRGNLLKTYLASFIIVLLPLIFNMIAWSLLKEDWSIGSTLLFFLLLLLSIPLGVVAFINMILMRFMMCEVVFENTGGFKSVFRTWGIYTQGFGKLLFKTVLISLPWGWISFALYSLGVPFDSVALQITGNIDNILLVFPSIASYILLYEHKLSTSKLKVKWKKRKK